MATAWTLLHKPLLADRTTLGLGGHALAEIRVFAEQGLPELPGLLASLGGKPVAFGAGSNIVAADGELPLVLLSAAWSEGPEVAREEEGEVFVRVSGGQRLCVLLGKLAAAGFSGLEGLAGIPGSVGGAIAMNAGSFGHAMGDALESVTVYAPDGGRQTAGREELELGYRHMAFRGKGQNDSWFMITSAVARLKKSSPGSVRAAMREHMARKKNTQPVGEKSAGCVFKNPSPDMPAGKLLDEAGFRGKRLGGMMFSHLHANFLVNEGKGTAEAAFDLIDMAREAVRLRCGVVLEPEVKIWR